MARIYWRCLFWVDFVLTFFITLKPIREESINLPDWLDFADKVAHFIFFGAMSFLFAMSFKWPIFKTALLVFGLSFVIEVLQFLMPFGRSFDVFDLLANAVGIVFGLGVYSRLHAYLLR